MDKWELVFAPTDEEKRRYKVLLKGNKEEVEALQSEIGVNCSRIFVPDSSEYDWAFYVYKIDDKKKEAVISLLNKYVKTPPYTVPPEKETSSKEREINLNPSYTFDRFVIGTSNRFTHAACLAVAKNPGKIYNPLFIYGDVGLGKTHLMHAIGNYILQSNPNLNVFYVSTERFTSEVIEAIAQGKITEFRNFYKQADILLIDDIQFLAESESTQEEFFHTFNVLHENQKQIVITSDKPPKQLVTLEERLKSRFEWGLIADIKRPTLEMRVAILKKKGEDVKIQLDDEILIYVANRLESNIRELEGFLKRINAYGELTNQPISRELVVQLLDDLLPAKKEPVKEEVKPKVVEKKKVCSKCGKELSFIAEYNRWYCYTCKTYEEEKGKKIERPIPPPPEAKVVEKAKPKPPPPPPPKKVEKPCPICGNELTYIEKYDRWYCYNCGKYEEKKIEKPIPPPPPEEKRVEEIKPKKAVEKPKEEVEVEEIKPKKAVEKPKKEMEVEEIKPKEKVEELPKEKVEKRVEVKPKIKKGVKVVEVAYFYPEDKNQELEKVKELFLTISQKHKLKFELVGVFEKSYEIERSINYDLFSQLCKTNNVSIAVVIGPPPGPITSKEFEEKITESFEKEDIALQFIPFSDITKQYKYLNILLDIALLGHNK